ncbi:diguanylate cyclase [Piscinibacter sp. HJYY11]|uniref:diguanylate cyclase n=1 Tax=Piscinibacter sp. HJYY11 TaxID=2801333 RepID=UPI00191D63CE|nr:diguanylate cyclase [Piscinibacter sp. HJYY11]MBL0729256.1 diguanylate cyclase [Piscinibacter sp. HJYY11]
MDPTAHLLERLLLGALLPVWMLAGLADWACHRRERIELSAGWKESALHLLMLGELGLAVLLLLWCQVTATVLLLVLVACVLHEITLWLDLTYASSKRVIPPIEQWVHGLQMGLPWLGLLTLCIAHRGQALALLGLGPEAVDWSLRLREPPVPAAAKAAVLAGAALMVVLPFLQEWQRARAVRPASPPSGRTR